MNSTAIQEATKSIIDLANPHPEALQLAVAMINLALMCRVDDIDYADGYRTALKYIREVLSHELEKDTND